MQESVASTRRTFLGAVGGAVAVAVVGSGAAASAATPGVVDAGTTTAGTAAAKKAITRLEHSIRLERIEAKLGGTAPSAAAISSWKEQIKLEKLRGRVAQVGEATRQGDPRARGLMRMKVQRLERKAAQLAQRLG